MSRQTLKQINLCILKKTDCKTCPKFTQCINFAKFYEKHSYTAKYAHFSYRTSLADNKTRAYVMNPKKVARHGFFPFVNFTKKETKYNSELPDHIKYKERELYYAAHLDRCIYQYYGHLLNQAYDRYSTLHGLDSVAIAYRDNNNKTSIHCAKEAFDFLKATQKALVIINDFTGFFDSLNHEYLKEMICLLLETDRLPADYKAIWKNITRFSWLEWEEIVQAAGMTLQTQKLRTTLNSRDKLLSPYEFRKVQKNIHKNTKNYGIPQGSPISAVLANVYMAEFDVEMQTFVNSHNGLYKRYSDDTIVIIPYSNENEPERFLKDYNSIMVKYQSRGLLKIKPEKTEIAISRAGEISGFQPEQKRNHIDYLGFRFKNNTVIMRPRSITKYFYRLKRQARRIYNDCNIPTHISYSDIYKRFSDCHTDNNGFGNFITYAKKADRIIGLKNDTSLQRIIKLNKMYIRRYINQYANIIPRIDQPVSYQTETKQAI